MGASGRVNEGVHTGGCQWTSDRVGAHKWADSWSAEHRWTDNTPHAVTRTGHACHGQEPPQVPRALMCAMILHWHSQALTCVPCVCAVCTAAAREPPTGKALYHRKEGLILETCPSEMIEEVAASDAHQIAAVCRVGLGIKFLHLFSYCLPGQEAGLVIAWLSPVFLCHLHVLVKQNLARSCSCQGLRPSSCHV